MRSKITACLFIYLAICGSAMALQFTEISYDPEGTDSKREWVEVFNDGDTSIDLSTYGFLENEVNHGISHFSGPAEISPGAYAIIAADAETFKKEFPIEASIYDSVFTLNNTGETVSLLDDTDVSIASVTYSADLGANGDGNTLNRISASSLQPRSPSPGQAHSENIEITPTSSTSKKQRTLSPTKTKDDTGVDYSAIPEFAIAEQEITLKVSGPNSYKYLWRLPNGGSAVGKFHDFKVNLPGTVSVGLQVKDSSKIISDSVYKVTVEEPRVTLSTGYYKERRYLKIENSNQSLLNMSNWQVMVGADDYQLPTLLLLNQGDTYAFYLDRELSYPIKILDQKKQLVTQVSKPKDNVAATTAPVSGSDSVLPKTVSPLVLSSAGPQERNNPQIDVSDDNQAALREEFESYGLLDPVPNEGSLEKLAVNNGNQLAAGLVGSQQALDSNFSAVRTITNSFFILLLGAGLALLLLSKKTVALQRSEVKTDQGQGGDNVEEYDITVVDDEEDF